MNLNEIFNYSSFNEDLISERGTQLANRISSNGLGTFFKELRRILFETFARKFSIKSIFKTDYAWIFNVNLMCLCMQARIEQENGKFFRLVKWKIFSAAAQCKKYFCRHQKFINAKCWKIDNGKVLAFMKKQVKKLGNGSFNFINSK